MIWLLVTRLAFPLLAPAVVWLSPKSADLGTIPRNQAIEHLFVYQNNGDRPLTIDNVRTTCGCTAPDWTMQALSPGSIDTLRVVVTRQDRGTFQKKIKVYFHHQRQAEVLTIRGQVE